MKWLVLEPVTATLARIVCCGEGPEGAMPRPPLSALVVEDFDPAWPRTRRVENYGTEEAAVTECPAIAYGWDAATRTLSGLPNPSWVIFDAADAVEVTDGEIQFVDVIPGTYAVLVRAPCYQHLDLELAL